MTTDSDSIVATWAIAGDIAPIGTHDNGDENIGAIGVEIKAPAAAVTRRIFIT